MLGPDSYYTPIDLSERLLSFVRGNPSNAIDFCVGDGGLLSAAEKKYPEVECLGIDISSEAIDSLKERKPSWTLMQCDFKDVDAVNRLSFLAQKKVDLVLMNPPFTCRGGRGEIVALDGCQYRVSVALSFVVSALPFLSERGAVYSILPISCVYSEKDRACWDYLKRIYNARVLEEVHKANFSKKCTPNIVLVYLGRVPYGSATRQKSASVVNISVRLESIYRGHLSVHMAQDAKAGKGGRLFIHTTNLRNGEIERPRLISNSRHDAISGFGVLIPRVCNPDPGKIVVVNNGEYILSDCVFFLKTRTLNEAEILKRQLLSCWTSFSRLYVGTGARYITVSKLRDVFPMSTNGV